MVDAWEDALGSTDAPAQQVCPHAARCQVRVTPVGAQDVGACELVTDCGLLCLLKSGQAKPKQDDAPVTVVGAALPRGQSLCPSTMTEAKWNELRKEVVNEIAAQRRAGAQASRYAVRWGGSLHEWQRNRPTYASVAAAVHELCDRAPSQWAPAIKRMAAMPRTLREIQRWDGAVAAQERLAEFDAQHGDALAWVLSDDELRERAWHLARQVEHTVGGMLAARGVDEAQAVRARDRLQACEEFERATCGKTAAQVRHETGRELALWARADAMTEMEKMAARDLLERLRGVMSDAVCYVVHKCQRLGCEPPKLKKMPQPLEVMAAVNRAKDEMWWRRTLRRAAARIVEAGAIKLGMVNRRTGGYVSTDAIKRRRQQLRRNANTLATRLYRNEAGQIYTLAELAAASVANPVNRGGELMTRIRGCEEHADAAGHVGLFVTLTAPSAMHAMLSREWREKGVAREAADTAGQTLAADAYSAVRNPRYDGHSTPRDAQAWLVRQWGKSRAAMARKDLKPYGFRVAEPHHDGTPHWHMLLWVKSEEEAQELQKLLYKYWVQNDKQYAGEKGAAKSRTNFKRLNAGGAAGYIAKYIAKSIGHHALKEHYDESPTGELMTVEMGGEPGHVRVDAWASCWGIRQFQPIGQPSVTVWREVRRVTPDQIEALSWAKDAQAQLAWDAAQKIGDKQADWACFIRAMGGVCLRREDYSLQPACRAQARMTRYGEPARSKKIVGVRTRSGAWLISRRLRWVPLDGAQGREAREARERAMRGQTPQDEAHRAALAAPWTGFNNCTARLTEGRANCLYAEAEAQAEAQAQAQKWDVIGRYLQDKYTKRLVAFGATDDELAKVASLHGRALMQRMGCSVPQILRGMEQDGWTRNGVAKDIALSHF